MESRIALTAYLIASHPISGTFVIHGVFPAWDLINALFKY
jgi:hypothetical protein